MIWAQMTQATSFNYLVIPRASVAEPMTSLSLAMHVRTLPVVSKHRMMALSFRIAVTLDIVSLTYYNMVQKNPID